MTPRTLLALALALPLLACDRGPDNGETTGDPTTETSDTTPETTTPPATETEPPPSDLCHTLPASSTFTGLIPADRVVLVDPADAETTTYPGTETGLDEALETALAIGSGDDTWAPETVDIDIVEVTVTNVGYKPAAVDEGLSLNVWVASGDGTMRTFLASGNAVPEPTPGDVVSFKVTEVDYYFGPQITVISGWTNHTADGGEPNDVLVRDSTGVDLEVSRAAPATAGSYASDLHWPHKIYGEITSHGSDCGFSGQQCYDLTHGGLEGEVLEFRTWPGRVFRDDCIVVYGNLGEFGGDPQIDALQTDWYDVWAMH